MKPTLALHPLRPREPYILGVFLTGAYQEILGDLHNLFGDTNTVHIRLQNGGYEVSDLVRGDTVSKVLEYVQYHTPELITNFRRKVARARLPRQEANSFIADYMEGLDGYTYLESPLEHADDVDERGRIMGSATGSREKEPSPGPERKGSGSVPTPTPGGGQPPDRS